MTPFIRYCSSKQVVQVFAPGYRYGSSAKGIFQDQGPADDPGDHLTHRSIGVGIGASGYRDNGSEFRIAKSREGAADGGDYKGDGNGGSRMTTRCRGCPYEQACTDDSADPQGYQ